jgi:sterol desaturase/sphingolipid hydroxylase (fatty acid hydroxylase superfamily)
MTVPTSTVPTSTVPTLPMPEPASAGLAPPWRPPLPPPAAVAPPDPATGAAAQRRRRRRWIASLVAAAAVVASLAMELGAPIAGLVALFVLVVPFEKLYPRHRGQRIRRPALGTDIAYAIANPALNVVSIVVGVFVGLLSLAWLPALLLRPLVAMLPAAITPFVGIVLFDLAIYWVHRWSHEVPFLWRFHSIHHSTTTLDWVSGFRNHPFDGAILAPPFVFLLAAGFSPEFSGALAVVQIVTGLFLHANVRFRWKPLHRVVITPEFHHWHHANELDARNTNYSAFLPLWDILFGTYFMPKDRRPAHYGVDEPIPAGMGAQLLHPLRGAPSVPRALRHPWRSLRALGRGVVAVGRDVRRSTFRQVRRLPSAASAGTALGSPASRS